MKRAIPLAILAVATTFVLAEPAAAAAPAAPAVACTWTPTALPLPAGAPGALESVGATDHSGGYAARVYFSADGGHAVVWKNGAIIDYGTFVPSNFITIVDMNRAGILVVNSEYGQWAQVKRAFRIRAGQREELPLLSGGSQAIAEAINDRGDIVGTNLVSRNGSWVRAAVRWPADRPAAVDELPGIPGDSQVLDLDQDGTLLLAVYDSNRIPRPHLWRNGTLTRVPELAGTRDARVVSISNGRIAGGASSPSGRGVGVYWDAALVPHQLPSSVEVQLINRDGLIAGSYLDPNGAQGVWRLGTLEQSLGPVFTGAVSDDGTIAGRATVNGRSAPVGLALRLGRCRLATGSLLDHRRPAV